MLSMISKSIGVMGTTRSAFAMSKFLAPSRSLLVSAKITNAFSSNNVKPYSTFKEISIEAKKHRPLSPHLSIYKPAMSFYMSGANRITSLIFTFGSMLGCVSAAVAPFFGVHFDSAAVVSFISTMPDTIFYALKIAAAGVVSYHTVVGLRFLVWTRGKLLKLSEVQSSGLVSLALVAVSTVYLAFFF
ncbi:Succinate dehydrogenase cytochrome B subunit, mitochondrial [Smittium mucronatum]|uniref:Succinate dehydrogenase cytochrome B subunit, mitochondrial n=1 Tax=Smittium mucronatum TaxID=133383 RepID=A0A1R0GVQ7_9FUNG|nr:Succinate dehydrogenase cytochrome B subunit, mitochondrial [Smittium mucronatum]